MLEKKEPETPIHAMKLCIGGTFYLIESRAVGGQDGNKLFEYRVWCRGNVVKEWTSGDMAIYFNRPEAGESEQNLFQPPSQPSF